MVAKRGTPSRRGQTAERGGYQTVILKELHAIISALVKFILYVVMHNVQGGWAFDTANCPQKVNWFTEKNREARLRTRRQGSRRLQPVTRQHIRQASIVMRLASSRSTGGQEAMPTSHHLQAQGDGTPAKSNLARAQEGEKPDWKRRGRKLRGTINGETS